MNLLVFKPEKIIRILIADDHPMMRTGVRATLEIERDMKVVGEASDGAEAISMFHLLRPDVTLIDLQMPKVDGLVAITEIRQAVPTAVIIVLTTYPGDARVTKAISLGATSYLLKVASSEEIVATVRGAASGRRHVAEEVIQDVHAHQGMEPLNVRELGVLRLAAQGKSNRAIGETLNLSEETVKTRMKAILAKLNANDRTHAVSIAIRRGFLDP
ncbi:response regulator transcription factor [Pinirhizobacter sp.]|jgi:DNA-binding NarL/FixJ family response regulator|uniref:response regulator transcription factor n=1 Tax=Pinirhizobacter sp. TaxID=2950432 RepID=UPI002F42DB8F